MSKASVFAPMATSDDDEAGAGPSGGGGRAKRKPWEFVYGFVAAVLVILVGGALFGSSPAPPARAPAPPAEGAATAAAEVGERGRTTPSTSEYLPVWDPSSVEFYQLPRPEVGATRGYYTWPSYRQGVLVFISEGDIWRAPDGLQGGLASRITSHAFAAGSVVDAELSADGRMVAFSATVDGGRDAFVLPVSGGPAQRLTYGDGALVRGWASSTEVLFTTRGYSDLPDEQLVAIDISSGDQRVFPVHQACDGVVDPQSGCLFFVRVRQNSKTKRYMGGTAEKLWRYCPSDGEATPVSAAVALALPSSNKTSEWTLLLSSQATGKGRIAHRCCGAAGSIS